MLGQESRVQLFHVVSPVAAFPSGTGPPESVRLKWGERPESHIRPSRLFPVSM
jgi:hypothetical protein